MKFSNKRAALRMACGKTHRTHENNGPDAYTYYKYHKKCAGQKLSGAPPENLCNL